MATGVSIDTTDASPIRCGGVPGPGKLLTGDDDEAYKKLFGDEDSSVLDGGFLNSTLLRDTRTPVVVRRPASKASSMPSLFGVGEDDYKGGLLLSARPEEDNSSSGPASISSRPSDSSRGFHNTFNVLERHLQSKHFQSRQLRRFLQYNESSRTPVFCNVPPSLTDSSNYLRSISEESSGGTGSGVTRSNERRSSGSSGDEDHEPPSFLELELEASDRLRRLRERLGGSVPDLPGTGAGSGESPLESPLTKALYGISLESLARTNTGRVHPDPSVFIDEEEDRRSLSGEYPDYPYYVARGADGLPYLKVVRSSAAAEKGRCLASANIRKGERVSLK
ncbi:hypothetical protein ZHAS_00014169 [Anopheles sinensis]|uniref:Uncharacterized protein n=1 Tax=Anopheles sinensis TaxID=74873 RepID=A0A084W7H4_ANOSI|nr:hypothetical protein ZHAS_00014169 [Anopheles sinensis]